MRDNSGWGFSCLQSCASTALVWRFTRPTTPCLPDAYGHLQGWFSVFTGHLLAVPSLSLSLSLTRRPVEAPPPPTLIFRRVDLRMSCTSVCLYESRWIPGHICRYLSVPSAYLYATVRRMLANPTRVLSVGTIVLARSVSPAFASSFLFHHGASLPGLFPVVVPRSKPFLSVD